MRKMQRFKLYEQEKEKLRRENLPPAEYERRMREIAKKLKL